MVGANSDAASRGGALTVPNEYGRAERPILFGISMMRAAELRGGKLVTVHESDGLLVRLHTLASGVQGIQGFTRFRKVNRFNYSERREVRRAGGRVRSGR
jgi:hypothetical protein